MTVPPPATPPTSRKIIIVRFGTSTGAKLGLDQLKNAGTRLGNGAVIEREPDGTVKFNETKDWGIGKSAAVGAVAALSPSWNRP
jgi:hypothetical protein